MSERSAAGGWSLCQTTTKVAPLPQETAGLVELAKGAATTDSAAPMGMPAGVSWRSDTPL